MKIEVNLTTRQAKAVRAVSRALKLSEAETLVAAAVTTFGMEWEDPPTLLGTVRDVAKRRDRFLIPPDQLPCGLRI